MPSFPRKVDARRAVYLGLSNQIESQLRDAYSRRFEAGIANQSTIAEKLGINRSAVHHRLMGHTNMTMETIADMVWALGYEIRVKIYDPLGIPGGLSASQHDDRNHEATGAKPPRQQEAVETEHRRSSFLDAILKPKESRQHGRSNAKRSALEAVVNA